MTFRQLRQILPALLLLGATAAGAEEPARDCDTALHEADAALSAGAFEAARRTYARCLDSSVAGGDFDSGSRAVLLRNLTRLIPPLSLFGPSRAVFAVEPCEGHRRQHDQCKCQHCVA